MASRQYYNSLKSMGDIISEVSEWSPADIGDTDLLSDYLTKLPTSFDDPYQYFLAFGALTLEEVRAQIGAGLDTLVTTSSLPVENAVLHCSHSAFTISVGFRAKDESYRSRPLRTCDVLLLTPDAKTGFPITTSKREVIGVVKETDDFEPDVNPIHWCKVHLHTSHEQGFKLALQTRSGRQLWGAALLTSIPVVRSLRRLVAGWEHGSCFPHFMSTIMGRHDQAASRTTGAPVRQEVLMNVLGEERNLNESQKNCIAEVLRRDGVHLIHGPPGTGKTTTLVTLLSCLFESDILTVQAAPTNIAVIEVAKRFLARIQSARNFRARNTLGDIVLIGDDERMDLDGLLDSIFLDRRVDRLEEVLKKWPTSLLDLERFLTEFPKAFHEAQHTPNETEPSRPEESAWEFFWRISSGHIIDIEKSIIIFLSDLPSSVLVTSTREELTKNLELVRKFSNYLEAYRSEYQETKDFAQSYSRRAISPKLLSSIDRLRESTAVVAGSTSCLSILSAESGKQLERRLLAGVRVIFSTVGCTGRRIMDPVLKNAHTVIVDEATQLPEAVTALLFRRTLSRLILAGDHKQLPATVISPLAKDNLYGRSLFERLKLSQHTSSFLLDIQYRMRPEISEFPTRVFYGGQLKDWEGLVEKQPMPWHIAVTAAGQRLFPPFAVIDLDSIEIKDPFGTSIYNETEADFIANYITHFANVLVPTHNMVVGIGVVTPYVAQVETIKKRLGNVADKADDGVFRISPGIEVEVKTVDGSQGQEKDVIIISLVRSNKYGEIGFVEDERRLNVALTRAKHSCFVIGNTRTLTRRNLIFNKLVAESKNRGVHLNFRDYPDLAKLTNNQSLATHHLKINSTPSRDLQTSLMRNTLWKMNLTRNALDAIRTMSIGKTKEKVLGFLNALAEGYRPKNRNRFSVLTYQKVIESWVVAGDFAVVWGIALEAQEHSYIQIIQVYKIVSKTNINEAIKQVTLSLSRHSDDYLKAISQIEKEDVPSTDKQRIVPSTFARVPRILWHRPLEDNKDNDESGEDEVHDELTLSKKHRLTAEVARLILKNTIDEIELPISLSEDETSIVNENGSLFILGRSGTGKTTVMLMRMFQREQAYYIQMDSYERKPIQVMLTASSTLCADMNSYYYKLRKSIVRPEEQDQELQESGSRPLDNARLDDLPDTAFICFSDFLAILDRHLEKPFLLRNRRLMNLDNAIQEGDWDEQFEIGREVIQESRAYRTTTLDDGREVTFSRFRDVYWKHFDLYFQRKYDVSAIWMEFQSCIKGSLNSLLYPRGILPLDVFVELADSGSFTFNRDERNEIYRLFLKYETKKRGKRDWDVGDLTSHIFLELANTRYRGRIIDYIYVDEVQDLTPAQIAIFKYVCRDRCGFVFAGDTAQTISAGVGFRFQSVRDLFYYNILPYIDSTLTSVKTFIPSTHVLNQNYRTHTGVLNLASWVVEMLYQSFPSMVDKLPREKSLIPGRKPLFLEDTTMDEVLIHLFGMGKVRNEFDAEQTIIVIIVRDEIIKEEIALLVQEHNALVLTVYEAKGLEFENVLCYDFFADSPFEKWRVLWQPDLVDEKHQILCSELKALYVVITRCTKKLWFFDRERKKSQPALDIWQSQNLVKCVPAANQRRHWNKIPSLETNAEISWAERWKRFGTNLFEKRLYKDAGKCFARAQDHHNAELCEALVAETEGEIHADNGKMAESHQKYYDAAKIFEKIGEHRRAGAAYKAALKFDKAQKMFCILSEYDNALDCCLKGKLYMKALIIFQSANVDKKVKEILGRRFAILCHSAQDTENMLNFLEYTGPEVRRSFLERYKYYNELLQSDTHTKRYERMAEVYERKGELFEAARCWKQHGDTAGQTRVLLRLAQPLFCFTLAGIQLDAVADLQKIRNLLRDIIGSDSAVSFELKFLVDMFDASPTDTSTWTRLLNEIQARKGVGCGGLELMAKFLVMQALWRDDCWQADPQTFIKALKSCRRELSVLNKNLADTILSERKYECYRVFGLEASRNPEYCLVDNTVLLTVRSSLGSRKALKNLW
ncbi:AAA domain-containing protein [Jimgerdemannia flammicorona]|uniref:AAA domain-containing protein n=1 Tax=Jimgerdemannia flammicorona TaxID=994334 RepID=A0A433QJE3_9FUNG|nr:AAA domain-containing protein [Jimgerdemannia flammicorona]